MAWAVSSGDPNHWSFRGLMTWQAAKDLCVTKGINYGSYQYNWWETEHPYHYTRGLSRYIYAEDDTHWAGCFSSYKYPEITTFSTNIVADCLIYVYAMRPPHSSVTNAIYNLVTVSDWEWVSGYISNSWNLAETLPALSNGVVYGSKVGDNDIDFDFPSEPHTDWAGIRNNLTHHYKGWQITDKKAFLDWHFNYCTNKYW
jgi:hypothetical protein